jgi:DNA-binding transcriptional LysR family regulator
MVFSISITKTHVQIEQRRDNMKLDALHVFLLVADYEHITRAAEELMLTQPAVTRTIHSLEQEAGLPLFERQGRRIALTQAGRIMQTYVRRIIALERELEESLADLRDVEAGEVIISASKTTGAYLLPPAIARFRTLHPHIALQLTIHNSYGVTEQVLSWRADIGLVEGDISTLPPELAVEVIATDELVLVIGPTHRWRGMQAVTPEMLGANELVLREQGSGTREVIERALQQQGVQVSPLLTAPENETIKQLVMQGMGAAILPALVVQREVMALDLLRIPIVGLDLHREFSLVRRADKQLSRAADSFCATLRRFIE